MKCAKLVLALVALQAITTLVPQRVAADDPLINRICDRVDCGMGTCNATLNYTFGFACECKPGWSRFHMGDWQFHFLPCVIPNCSINYSCHNGSQEPAPAPAPPEPINFSIFDPCLWEYCGGGTCEKASDFTHKCVCNEGFSNLLNDTAFPCYRKCSLGADCTNLGIQMTNSSNTSPPAPFSFSYSTTSSVGGSSISFSNLLELLVLVSFIWTQTIW